MNWKPLIFGLAVMVGGAGAAAAAEPIKIGAIGPLSGPAATSGIAMQKGWEYVAEQVNSEGGIEIGGEMRPIEMIFEDCQSRPEVGVSAAQKLLTRDNVDILVGDLLHSSVTLAIMELAPSFNDRIFYSGQPVSIEIAKKIATDKEKYGNFWKFDFNSDAYASTIHQTVGMLMADGAFEPNNKTLAFIIEDTDYGKSNVEYTVPLFEADGWTVTANEAVQIGHADFFPQLSKLRADEPDLLVSIFTAPNSGVALVKQMEEQGIASLHMGIYYPSLDEFLEGAGDAGNGLLFSPLLFDVDFNPEHQAFSEKMETFLGEPPSGDHAFGVCNAALMMDALKRAGSTEVGALGKAMAETDFECVLGRWVFDQETHSPLIGEEYFAVPAAQIQDGNYRVIWPKSSATADYQPQS